LPFSPGAELGDEKTDAGDRECGEKAEKMPAFPDDHTHHDSP
jgi:hypothetical protein